VSLRLFKGLGPQTPHAAGNARAFLRPST
jgi:hypothetical protein